MATKTKRYWAVREWTDAEHVGWRETMFRTEAQARLHLETITALMPDRVIALLVVEGRQYGGCFYPESRTQVQS